MTVEYIIIQQGATFQRDVVLNDKDDQPLDVAGFTANAAIKKEYYSNTYPVLLFQTALTTGQLSLRLEASDTGTLAPGYYVYDAIVTNGTEVYRPIEGIAEVDAGVTGIVLTTK